MSKIISILFSVFLSSSLGYGMVAGYEFDFSQSEYIVNGSVIRGVSIEDNAVRVEIYTIKINKILARGVSAESKNSFPIREGEEIKFLYARHSGWPDTGYSAMVGNREPLREGVDYKIPMNFDDKTAMYGVFDKWYNVASEDKVLVNYLNSLPK